MNEITTQRIFERYNQADADIKRFYLLFFIALASAFAFVEYMIPKPLPMLRLGLANAVVILFILHRHYRAAFLIALIRPILVSFVVGNIFSPPFWLGLSGSLCASLCMIGVFALFKKAISPIGISLIGAFVHITAQLFMVYLLGILPSVQAIISIGSIMALMALAGGLITGSIAIYLYERL